MYLLLLKYNHVDSRKLLNRQALDLLVPLLARYSSAGKSQLLWVRILKRQQVEEMPQATQQVGAEAAAQWVCGWCCVAPCCC